MAMTPDQFLARIAKQPPAPVYLFLGPEGYQRRLCKEALVNRVLPGDARTDGLTQIDLQDLSLSEVLDDARSLSLFSQERVIWVSGAENALPRRITANSDDEDAPEKTSTSALSAYIKAPTPGTVVIFECSRYEFSGDDRAKLERVEKFFAPVPTTVEFRPFTPEASRFLAQELARQYKLQLSGAELAALLDAVAGDANRLASEMEKLSLFVEPGRKVTMDDLRALVPNASQSTIFALVNALGHRDRAGALRSLDILIREGEYLPLALTFLSTQFRLALAAKESRITAQQAQSFFSNLGVRIWRDRIEQVMGTASVFTAAQLSKALSLIYETDRKFRDSYKDDRTVMETLVLALTN
ncbi:MAG TPA: DNA polymerase III subunit delta [Bryobacteraceae bacterium]|jgi:DNA polymerase-3 subunit delta|nr:DNA polymerase III subunit delta [Bryobacteraceae bacterium]